LIRSSLRFVAIRVSKRSPRRSFLRGSSPVVRPQRD